MPSHEAELILSCKATGTDDVKKFNDAVVKVDKVSEHAKNTIKNLFSTAVMAKFGSESLKHWATQEKAVLMLESALRNQGAAYRNLTGDLMEFNSEMQRQTVYGDEQIALIQAQGLNMGVTSDRIKEATKAAIGLSAAYNMNLSSAMMLIARASQGQTQMLSRYGIVLGENLSPQEKYNKLLELGASKMSIANDMTKTLEGSIQQMKNAVGDAQEQVGKVFAPTISALAGGLQGLSQWFSGLPEPMQRIIVMTGTFTTGMTALKTAIGLKALAESVATGTSLAHGAAMKQTAVSAKEQQRSMAALAEFGARLNAQEIERAALATNVNIAISDRAKGYDALISAESKVSQIQEKVAEASKGYQEALSACKENPFDAFATEDVKFQVENLNKLNRQLAIAKSNVEKLKNQYIELGKGVDKARIAQNDFNEARRKEKKYLRSDEANRAAQVARVRALRQGKSALEANIAAENAYSAVVAKQTAQAQLNTQAENLRNQALARGATIKQADAIKTEFLANANKKAAVSGNMFTRGIKGIGVAARATGVALKGMMASMLPMLALSLAIEGIMHLAGKAKREAEAANEIAAKETESVQKLIQANETLRQQDHDKLRRYEELARISDRTQAEQEELIRIARELNGTYNGLNVPLLKQNDILNDTSKLWDRINAKQRQNILDEQKKLVLAKNRELDAKSLKIYANHQWGEDHGLGIRWGFGNTWWDAVQGSVGYARINMIKDMMKTAKALKNSGLYSDLNDYLVAYQQLLDLRKQYADLASGATAAKGKAQKQSNLDKILRDERGKYNDAVARGEFDRMNNAQKLVALQKKLLDYKKLARNLENYQNSEANIKKYWEYKMKILDIDKQIRDLTNQQREEADRIARQQKEESERLTQQYNERVLARRLRNMGYNEQLTYYRNELNKLKKLGDTPENKLKILDIEEKISEIQARRADRQRSKAEEIYNIFRQQQEAQANIWREMANAGRGFRQTAQESVNAYSLEAVKLQSRMFISPKFSAEQLQKKMVITAGDIRAILEDMKRQQNETKTAIDTISRNLGVTSY